MTNNRMAALILPTIGLAATLGLTGCGLGAEQTAAPATDPAATADTDVDGLALQQVGFTTESTAASAPTDGAADTAGSGTAGSDTAGSGSDKTGKGLRRPAIRRYLRNHTLHGEITVQTRAGVRTVDVQRGVVTAVSPTGVTVKSSDGFSLTWVFGDKMRVVHDRRVVGTTALKVGEQVGVAGGQDKGATDARLIIIR